MLTKYNTVGYNEEELKKLNKELEERLRDESDLLSADEIEKNFMDAVARR